MSDQIDADAGDYPFDPQPFDPKLVSLIAAEVADPFDLAAEFGIPASAFRRLRETPAFKAALEHARKELEETGFSAEYAEMLILQEALPRMQRELITKFHQANTSLDQKIKLYEMAEKSLLARRARLSPKQTGATAGPGFSITINVPQVGEQPARSITIEGAAKELPDDE